jgi:hypothetical protein
MIANSSAFVRVERLAVKLQQIEFETSLSSLDLALVQRQRRATVSACKNFAAESAFGRMLLTLHLTKRHHGWHDS